MKATTYVPCINKRKLVLWITGTNKNKITKQIANKRKCGYCHLFGEEDKEDDRVEGWGAKEYGKGIVMFA